MHWLLSEKVMRPLWLYNTVIIVKDRARKPGLFCCVPRKALLLTVKERLFMHVDVAPDPGVRFHVKRGFDICVATIGQAGHKEIDLDFLVVMPDDLHCRAAPVHHASLARLYNTQNDP